VDSDLRAVLKNELYVNLLPESYRRYLWLHCSGAYAKMKSSPDYYKSLHTSLSDYPETFNNPIEMDLMRTFPDK